MHKPNPHTLGKQAEKRAIHHLTKQGYTILERNYRFQRREVDIIAQQPNLLLFIEVKVRSNPHFGPPETFVTNTQQKRYHEVATHYIEQNNWQGTIRFDIIALTPKQKDWQITHLKDAFY